MRKKKVGRKKIKFPIRNHLELMIQRRNPHNVSEKNEKGLASEKVLLRLRSGLSKHGSFW